MPFDGSIVDNRHFVVVTLLGRFEVPGDGIVEDNVRLPDQSRIDLNFVHPAKCGTRRKF